MELSELINKLKILLVEHGNGITVKVKQDKALYQAVLNYTSFLSSKIKLKTRIYRVIHGLHADYQCLTCKKTMDGKDVKTVLNGYRLYCCQQCAKDSDLRKLRYMNTCLKKYGVENASSVEQIKNRRRITNLNRFGVDNPAKLLNVQTKIADTNLKRYGTACALTSNKIHEKTIETIKSRYGVTSYSKTDEFKQKTITSNQARFGVDYPNQDPKIRKNAQKRYFYDNMHFDSAPELAFYIYCKDNSIDIVYQPDVCFQYSLDGKVFQYQPDFKVDDQYVEIKGLHFFEDKDPNKKMINPYDRSMDDIYEAKHVCMLEHDVLILTEKDYSRYIKYIKQTYGSDFLRKLKNK